MELNLKDATLNILNFKLQNMVLGENSLNVSEESVADFLLPILKKGFRSNKAKTIELVDRHPFMESIKIYQQKQDLNAWANDITKKLFQYMKYGAFNTVMDLIAYNVTDENENTYVGFAICEEKTTFTPLVNNTDIIVEQNSSISSTLKYFVYINQKTYQVKIIEGKTEYDGEIINLIADKLFNSGSLPSEEDTFKALKQTVAKVSQAYESTGIDEMAKLYTYMANNAEVEEKVNVSEAIDKAFKGQPTKAADAKQTLRDLNMLETLPMNKEFVSKKIGRIKIKTDTGIEISMPQEYVLTNDFVEIKEQDDGTINILIKGTNKISHK